MRSTFYIPIILTILLGCVNTEGTLEIGGKVLDEETEAPIPHRQIIIQALVGKEYNKKLTPIFVDQFTTDSNGCFASTLRKVKDAYHYNFYIVGDSTYAFSNNELVITELHYNAKYLSFYVSKLADLTITIERTSKKPAYDTLYLSWKSNEIEGGVLYPYKIDNFGVAPETGLKWIGGKVKSVIRTKAYANKQTVICWELVRNGKIREIKDTITCGREIANYASFKY